MKTKMITVYQFSELSEETQQKVLDKFRESIDTYWIYSEAKETVKAFEKYFPTDSKGKNSWLECSVNANNEVLELMGLRLRTYLINNFGYVLFRPKTRYKNNTKRVSKIFTETCCNLTGICYDDDMLSPIYKFICGSKEYKFHNFEELMKECYQNLEDALRIEEEYRQSDEAIIEDIECNGYEFTEHGQLA